MRHRAAHVLGGPLLRTTALLDGSPPGSRSNALGLTVITLLVQGGSGEATMGPVLGIGSAGALAGP